MLNSWTNLNSNSNFFNKMLQVYFLSVQKLFICGAIKIWKNMSSKNKSKQPYFRFQTNKFALDILLSTIAQIFVIRSVRLKKKQQFQQFRTLWQECWIYFQNIVLQSPRELGIFIRAISAMSSFTVYRFKMSINSHNRARLKLWNTFLVPYTL